MIPDGVYAGMPDEVYHADPALGSTDLKALLVNPVQWHARQRNPARDVFFPVTKDESVAKAFGKALHKIVLEGEEAFERGYVVEPPPPEGMLKTAGEVMEWIRDRQAGAPVLAQEILSAAVTKSGKLRPGFKLSHLEAAAKLMGCEVLASQWGEKLKALANGRAFVSAEWWLRLQMIRRVLDRHSTAPKYLRNGLAEVSVFWTDEDGCRFKARFDYLRERVTTDLKSYRVREGVEPIQGFAWAIEELAYDFSMAHYKDARLRVLPRLVEEGRIFDCVEGDSRGDRTEEVLSPGTDFPLYHPLPADEEFLGRVAAYQEPAWAWVACTTMGFPEVDACELPRMTLLEMAANTQLTEAKNKYKLYREKFGDDDETPWVSDRGTVILDESLFGRRSTDRGLVKWTRMEQ